MRFRSDRPDEAIQRTRESTAAIVLFATLGLHLYRQPAVAAGPEPLTTAAAIARSVVTETDEPPPVSLEAVVTHSDAAGETFLAQTPHGSDAGASAAGARDWRAGRGTQMARARRRHWPPAGWTFGRGRGVEQARKPEPPDHAAAHPLGERGQISLRDRSCGQEWRARRPRGAKLPPRMAPNC